MASVVTHRLPSGKWNARIRQHGQQLTSHTFDTKRQADDWGRRQLTALAGGVDLRAGRSLVSDLLDEWLAFRVLTVAHKTFQTDRNLARWARVAMGQLQVAQVTSGTIADELAAHAKTKRSSTLLRYRAVLRAFYGWCTQRGYIAANPVLGVRIPASMPPDDMAPYSREELEQHLGAWWNLDQDAAGLVEFIAATGLRWSEARALTPSDLRMVPAPAVIVSRAQPEGSPLKGTKSGKSRRVPLPAHVVPWVITRMNARYIAPIRSVKALHRRLDWANTSDGRRIHDLRHTAITLWLTEGVDMPTARHWAGHADLTTMTRYTGYLGTAADAAAIDLINKTRVHAGYTIHRKEDAC